MYMVGHGVDPPQFDAHIFARGEQIHIQAALMLLRQGSLGVAGAKYDVVIAFGICHVTITLPGFCYCVLCEFFRGDPPRVEEVGCAIRLCLTLLA